VVQALWEDFLKIAKEEAGSRVVETWFKAVSFQSFDAIGNVVYLQAPNQFVKNWLKSNYMALLQTHLGRLLQVHELKIAFVDDVALAPTEQVFTPSVEPFQMVPAQLAGERRGALAPLKTMARQVQGNINPAYTFDTFVVGPSNSLAYAAAHAITEKPGRLYNPLFVYGGSGLGKTHLLHAIGNAIKDNQQQAHVLYQTADRFVNEFISAIRFNKVHKFQEKYRDIDVLLIDDIQFISNKEQTQEAFFHIFNSLYEGSKQIVFSSDTFPQNIDGIAERLRSRLACGLVTDMYLPSLETKVVILKKKAALSGDHLPDEVAHFIASRVVSNIRELEGALIRVTAFSLLTKQPLTLELAKRVLIRINEQAASVDGERVIKILVRHYPYSFDELCSKNRNKDIVLVRQLAMHLLKKLTDKSLRDIGLFLGGRDHSTVVHALDKIETLLYEDRFLADKVKRIESDVLS
jgi:chromosomal replication initiator protein